MALYILNNVGSPLGQFDGYDALSGSSGILGGEVAQLVNYPTTGTDKEAADVKDGYVEHNPGGGLQLFRPIVTTTFGTVAATDGPFYLTDDGTASNGSPPSSGYGTLFGSLVGGNVGQTVTGGTLLGPHTAAGSGKITLWMNPGLYGVSLDALDVTNLVPATDISVGTTLSYTSAGKLTPAGGAGKQTNAATVARVVEWSTGDTLVTTPKSLTRVGVAGGTLAFKMLVIAWNPPITN